MGIHPGAAASLPRDARLHNVVDENMPIRTADYGRVARRTARSLGIRRCGSPGRPGRPTAGDRRSPDVVACGLVLRGRGFQLAHALQSPTAPHRSSSGLPAAARRPGRNGPGEAGFDHCLVKRVDAATITRLAHALRPASLVGWRPHSGDGGAPGCRLTGLSGGTRRSRSGTSWLPGSALNLKFGSASHGAKTCSTTGSLP